MADCDEDGDNYNPKLYFKSEWKHPRAPDLIDNITSQIFMKV